MATKHYTLSPSAASRWIHCPGSLKLSEGVPDFASSYAEEGTIAHEIAAKMVNGEPVPEDADPEMVQAGRVFSSFVNGIRSNWDVKAEGSEETFESQTIPEFGGTIDYYAIARGEHKLVAHVCDFKYGQGIQVSAEGNPQLLLYCYLLHEAYPGVDLFECAIVQPRRDPPISFARYDLDRVLTFADTVFEIAKRDTIKAGEHCRFCPALTQCPEVHATALEIAKADFSEDVPWSDRWLDLLTAAPAIKKLIEELPRRVLFEMQRGKEFAGWKAVETTGRRSWIFDEETTIRRLQSRRVGKKKTTEPRLKSPAKLEKEGYAEQIADLIHKPSTGNFSIVPDTDRRPGVNFQSVEETFEDLSFLE